MLSSISTEDQFRMFRVVLPLRGLGYPKYLDIFEDIINQCLIHHLMQNFNAFSERNIFDISYRKK